MDVRRRNRKAGPVLSRRSGPNRRAVPIPPRWDVRIRTPNRRGVPNRSPNRRHDPTPHRRHDPTPFRKVGCTPTRGLNPTVVPNLNPTVVLNPNLTVVLNPNLTVVPTRWTARHPRPPRPGPACPCRPDGRTIGPTGAADQTGYSAT